MRKKAIRIPDLGMQSEEIKFAGWLKDEGDTVTAGEDLFEVEADKATVICEAESSGILRCDVIAARPVKHGDVIGYLDAE
jgi:pyruvate/2-oxoglutarate dehydrogenase complex dihydrolipoamide acyltransferase (E2) component